MKDYRFAIKNQRLWEDLFVCCGWRIQRSLASGKKRLLDHWNIIRSEGSYQHCRDDFDRYAKAFELTIPQNKPLVVLIHGFGQTANSLSILEKKLNNDGFITASINYPSTRRSTKNHAEQIRTVIANLPKPSDISLITYGSGNLVLEKFLQQKSPFPKSIHLHRIIEINPVAEKNIFLKQLCRIKFIKTFLGPMGKELTGNTPTRAFSTTLGKIKVIISKPKLLKKITALLFFGTKAVPTHDCIKRRCCADEIITIDEPTDFPLRSYALQRTVIHFLKY